MNNSLGKDAVKLSTSKIITMLISLITAMMLSRFRTLKEYGTYSQIIMVINIVTTIFMLGLPNSINFFLARAETEEEKQRFTSTFYTLSTLLSFLTGLVLVISMPLIIQYFNNGMIKTFWYVLAIYPWTRIILSSIDNILIVCKKTSLLMKFRITNSIFLLIAVILTRLFDISFYVYMLIFILGEALFALSVYFLAYNLIGKIRILFDLSFVKIILKFSIPIGFASVIGTLKTETDKLFIANFYDTQQLAIYTNAAREMPVTIIASSLTAVLMPLIVKCLKSNDKDKAIIYWGNTISLSYLIICFIAFGLFTFAPEVITLLYSDKYLPGAEVFRVYSLVLLFRCTYFGMILNATGNTKFIFFSSLAALLVNIVLNFIFYYLFGFIGPAVATLISTFISAMILLIVSTKTIKISFKIIFPWRNMFYITILNIAMSFLFAKIKNMLMLNSYIGDELESVILGCLWGVLYFVITFRFIKIKWNSLKNIA